MNITRYTSEAEPRQKYLALVRARHAHVPSFRLSFADLTQLTSPEHPTQPHQKRVSFAVEDNGAFVAHCTLIVDKREQPGTGWFGFFECSDDQNVFARLWESVTKECRALGIHTLRGPINGTIWYPYRFAVPGGAPVPPFYGELLCADAYHGLFKSMPGCREVSYYSALREDFQDLIRITQPFYDGMRADTSLRLDELTAVGDDILREIFDLSRTVFQTSWGYVPLTDEELAAYYSQEKLNATLLKTYILRHNGRLTGFGTVFRENAETLVLKTLALDPGFQGKGLGNALIHRIHQEARPHCSRMIYACIRYENNVKRLPKDGAEVFREYGAFEIPVQ